MQPQIEKECEKILIFQFVMAILTFFYMTPLLTDPHLMLMSTG